MPLVDDIPQYNTGDDYAYYTNYAVTSQLEEVLESQNENLGTDIAPMDGKVVFRRATITPVIELDNDTTNPIYGINWGVLKFKALRGEWMRETVVPVVGGQHNLATTFTDCTLQSYCTDRRRLFVLATNTTMPS